MLARYVTSVFWLSKLLIQLPLCTAGTLLIK